jgi:hypothetical protein
VLLLYGLGAWLVFMVTAIANGAFRVAILMPSLGEQRAHLLSTLILCIVLIVEIATFLELFGDYSTGSLLALGAMWMLLTVAFEFGFGRYVAGQTWEALLANYNVARGRVWPAVPLVLLFAPVIIG